MPIHFIPYGSRGTPGTTHTMIENYAEGTAIDLYMSYGLQTLENFDSVNPNYMDEVATVLSTTIGDSPIKLLLAVSRMALDDIQTGGAGMYDKIDAIADEWDTDSKVWGYYVDEPNKPDVNDGKPANLWTEDTIGKAAAKLGKPFVVMVRSAGVRDAASTPVDTNPANQGTYNDYADADGESSVEIGGFEYPHVGSGWSGIGDIFLSGHPFDYIKNNSPGKDYWFAVEIKDGDNTLVGEAQLGWMTYRAIMKGASGVFFFNWLSAQDTGRQRVENVCKKLKDGSVHLVLSDNAPLTSGVTASTALAKGNSITSSVLPDLCRLRPGVAALRPASYERV